ncbi:MAG: choline kinase [marine bacterium B5-7]|nr:MAG: choline kinase [marine bacterium B5-7]
MIPMQRAASLTIWQGPVEPEPLGGGITNVNFVVNDAGKRYVVRVGEDIPEHQVMRFNELAASRAAHAAGISPKVVHAEPGVLVLEYIEGKTLMAEDVRRRPMLERIVPLIHRCHHEIPKYFRGAALIFWVFHVIRDYAHTLETGSSTYRNELSALLDIAVKLEAAIGQVTLVFGHNDLLPANLLDDGERLWLIDWDYGGFNSPLFDLGGLASNNEISEVDEVWLLEAYFDAPLSDDLRHRYQAMKCASLLRESLWSMVSVLHSTIDFDFRAYTEENLGRFQRAWTDFKQS